jgi:flagellar basal body-associated protein FliL
MNYLKEWFKKFGDMSAWVLGVIIVLVALATGTYFVLGWHKKKDKEDKTSEGTITNPVSKSDKLHNTEICEAINSLWEGSSGNSTKDN